MPDGIDEIITRGIVTNTLYNAISNIIGRLGGLIFTVIVARILLPELFGVYSLVLSIVLLLLTAIDSGVNASLIRFVSEAFNKNQTAKARTYFRFWLNFKLIIASIIAITLLLFAEPISIYIFNKPLLRLPLQVGAIYLLINSVLTSFVSLVYSIKKVKHILLQELILQVFKVLLIVLFLLILKSSSVSLVFLALLLSSLISILFIFRFLKTRYSSIMFGKKVAIEKKRMFRFFFFLAVTGITTSIFVHIDTIILGILIPSTKLIAFYQTALTIVQSAVVLITFSGNVFLPFFTQLRGKALEKQFKKMFSYSVIISVPAAFGLIFLAESFIVLIFGQEYLGAVIPLVIVSFILIETAAGTLFSTIMIVKEKPEYQMSVSIIMSILYIILSFVLIKAFAMINLNYSIIGASIATLMARYLAFFSLGFITYKKFKIKPDFKPIYKSIISSILMLLFLVLFDNLFTITFPWALVEIILGALFYFSFMWLIKGINRKDIELIKELFKK